MFRTFFLTEFDSHQKMVIQANIPAIVLNIAANDQNRDVRVTAMKCLQEITAVEEFWCYMLRTEHIYVSKICVWLLKVILDPFFESYNLWLPTLKIVFYFYAKNLETEIELIFK